MADAFVGCEFASYRDLEAAAQSLAEATSSRLVKSAGTRSAASYNALVRAPYLRVDERRIKYSFLNLTCSQGGCPFGLRAKACPKRQALVVVQLCLAHSHPSPAPSACGLRALGSMALREAALCGDLPALRALLGAGFAAGAACPVTGMTPLHWAAVGRRPEAARLLLAAGADPAAADRWGLGARDRAGDGATRAAVEAAPAGAGAASEADGEDSVTIAASGGGGPQDHDASSDDVDTWDSEDSVTLAASALPASQPSQPSQSPHRRKRAALTPFEADPSRHLTCPRARPHGAGHHPDQLAAWRASAPRLLSDLLAPAGRAGALCCWQCAGTLLQGLEAATGANLVVANSVSIESYVGRHPSSGPVSRLAHLKYAQVYVLCDHSPRLPSNRRPTRLPTDQLTCPFQLVLRARPADRVLYATRLSSLEHSHALGGPADRLSRRVGFSGLGARRLAPPPTAPPPTAPSDIGVEVDVDGDASGGLGVCLDVSGRREERQRQRRQQKAAYPVGASAPAGARIARYMALGFRCQAGDTAAAAPAAVEAGAPLPAPLPPPPRVFWSARAAGFPVSDLRRDAGVVTAVPGGRREPVAAAAATAGGLLAELLASEQPTGVVAAAAAGTWDPSTDEEAGSDTRASGPAASASAAAAAPPYGSDGSSDLSAWVSIFPVAM